MLTMKGTKVQQSAPPENEKTGFGLSIPHQHAAPAVSSELLTYHLEAEKRLTRRLDIHVVPIIGLLYMINFIDRANLGNARIQGLEDDLHMSGHDYNIAAFIFFIPYILCQLPSNLILRKVAPSTWLSGLMTGWGEQKPRLLST